MIDPMLKPCPMCGSEAVVNDTIEDNSVFVHCDEAGCGIQTPSYNFYRRHAPMVEVFESYKLAVAQVAEIWNTRKGEQDGT